MLQGRLQAAVSGGVPHRPAVVHAERVPVVSARPVRPGVRRACDGRSPWHYHGTTSTAELAYDLGHDTAGVEPNVSAFYLLRVLLSLEPNRVFSSYAQPWADSVVAEPHRECSRRSMNNGNNWRSLGFGGSERREAVPAQPCGFSEPERTGANCCRESTSWGSLVRAQYRPSKTLGLRGFFLARSHPVTDSRLTLARGERKSIAVVGRALPRRLRISWDSGSSASR